MKSALEASLVNVKEYAAVVWEPENKQIMTANQKLYYTSISIITKKKKFMIDDFVVMANYHNLAARHTKPSI